MNINNMILSSRKIITLDRVRVDYEFQWHIQCDSPLLESDLKEAQTKRGFSPCGYGFFQPIYSTDGEGHYHARWVSLCTSD